VKTAFYLYIIVFSIVDIYLWLKATDWTRQKLGVRFGFFNNDATVSDGVWSFLGDGFPGVAFWLLKMALGWLFVAALMVQGLLGLLIFRLPMSTFF
jgi:hypothetical protein